MPSGEDSNLIEQNEIWRERSKLRAAEAAKQQYLDAVKTHDYIIDGLNLDVVNLDVVNHPPHYTAHPSGVECIEITRHMNFNLGNAMKYIWRADMKHDDDGIQDLEKAAWYIQDEIQRRKDC